MVLFNRHLIFLFLFFSVQVSAQTFKDITYGTDDKQTLDIYVPDGKPPVEGFSVHVFVHGGAWNIGDKRVVKPYHAKVYTQQNVILIALNYRLAPKNPFPDFIDDIAQATAWINQNIARYGGNPKNMLLSGHSAGAHMVALLGVDPRYLDKQRLPLALWQAVVPVDTASFDLTQSPQGLGARLLERMKENAFGGSPTQRRLASPYYQVERQRKIAPFYLFVTAEREDAVAANVAFADKLRDKGHQASARVLSGGYSHADMHRLIFTPESEIFRQIIALLDAG